MFLSPFALCTIPKMENMTQKLKKARGAHVITHIFILSVVHGQLSKHCV